MSDDENEQKIIAWNESYAALGADKMISIWLDPTTSESTRNDYTAFVQTGYGFEGSERFVDVWNASPWTCEKCGFIGNNGEHFMSDCKEGHPSWTCIDGEWKWQHKPETNDTCSDCGDDKSAVSDLSGCTLCELVVCENCSDSTKTSDAVYCLDCFCLR